MLKETNGLTRRIWRGFLFSISSGFSPQKVLGVLMSMSVVLPKVSQSMNEGLLRPFLPKEIERAVFPMQPLKAPGPDGFGVCFFQHHWNTVGGAVITAALSALNSGNLDPSINNTYVAVAESMNDYRPTSLCNVHYKIIAKTLANRMKVVLPQIISPQQSAFVPGHLISDNILAAYETLHTMSTCMRGKKGYMVVKVDMSKAYDRVEWKFLEKIMCRLGFVDRWVSLIMSCASTVSYSILVNGRPTGHITPSRGIRQGDPLSPYLFLLVAEGLNSLLTRAVENGSLLGVPTSAFGIKLSHLFFADDSLFLCRVNFQEWCNLLQVMAVYEQASGQKLNTGKTSIFFRDYWRGLSKLHH
jgi:hypothetical protein